jgi:hypothetical protein
MTASTERYLVVIYYSANSWASIWSLFAAEQSQTPRLAKPNPQALHFPLRQPTDCCSQIQRYIQPWHAPCQSYFHSFVLESPSRLSHDEQQSYGKGLRLLRC